jgi:imidazole glycerol-phosphate synthase subunit HisH
VIALIDYQAGNLTSVKKALTTIGADVFVPEGPDALREARGIIVPGVGHFGATRALDGAWIEGILERIGEGRPLLGICLGMHWLFEGSDEAPDVPGLGLLSGQCHRLGVQRGEVRLKPDATYESAIADSAVRSVRLQADPEIKVPHVGWNTLSLQREASILEGVADQAQVYFTHSYVAPLTSETVAMAEHGEPFSAVVQRANIAGVQFHPEKSGEVGLRILRNFVQLAG